MKKLPTFRSREAVAKFFETRDPADYVPAMEETIELAPELIARIRAKRKKRQITLRLNEWMIDAAKDISLKTGVPYQILLKLWIAKGIHATWTTTRKGTRSSRRRA